MRSLHEKQAHFGTPHKGDTRELYLSKYQHCKNIFTENHHPRKRFTKAQFSLTIFAVSMWRKEQTDMENLYILNKYIQYVTCDM